MSFLDSTATPQRVLKLFEFLRCRADKSFETRDLKRAFQPSALEKVTDQSDQIGDAIKVCIGLGLAQRDTTRTVKLVDASPDKSSKEVLIEAFDSTSSTAPILKNGLQSFTPTSFLETRI